MMALRFDASLQRGYPFDVTRITTILGLVLLLPGLAAAETVAFVAPGEAPTRAARRAVLRCHELVEANEDLETLASVELRRALAGLPARGEGDDPLADVRQLVREAGGDDGPEALQQLGHRLEVDLLVTVRQAGEELEYRGFNVERRAFYRGSLMAAAMAPPDEDGITTFVQRRASALESSPDGEEGEAEEETPRRRSIWGRWWLWVIVGGAVAAAAVVGYVATPNEVEDTGVTLRVHVP